MELDVSQIASTVLTYADTHGSGLAAIAALFGIPLVLWQIFQGARQGRAIANARRYAALAALPMTLSGINRWAKEVVQSLNAIYPWVIGPNHEQPAPAFDPPPSPNHLISAIEQMIEAAPKDRIAKTLAAIVSDIQVLDSRIGDTTASSARELRSQAGMIDSNFLIAAQIYARAESLYSVSRSLSENAPLDYDRVSSALSIMDIRERPDNFGPYPTVHKMVERAHQKQLNQRRFLVKIRDWIMEDWRRYKK